MAVIHGEDDGLHERQVGVVDRAVDEDSVLVLQVRHQFVLRAARRAARFAASRSAITSLMAFRTSARGTVPFRRVVRIFLISAMARSVYLGYTAPAPDTEPFPRSVARDSRSRSCRQS